MSDVVGTPIRMGLLVMCLLLFIDVQSGVLVAV